MIVLKNILPIISNSLGVEKELINPDSHFYQDLNAEKIEISDLMLKLSQKYKFQINDESIINIKTVKDLLNLINSKIDEI